jgi:hypothetical protein
MNREFLELAKKATEEGWDAFRIMAEMIAFQKEIDAKIAENAGSESIANLIRLG